MNVKRSIDDYLHEIVECGTRALGYVQGMSFEQFEQDSRTRDAVAKCIELCGEAANNIGKTDPAVPKAFPEFDIRSAYGMRNILSHSYYLVKYRVLWSTAVESVPEFVAIARKILASRSPSS